MKTAGILLLASGAALSGWIVADHYKRKEKDLAFLSFLAEYLKKEILLFRTPLPDCFAQCPQKEYAPFLKSAAEGDYKTAVSFLQIDQAKKVEALRFLSVLGSGPLEEEKTRLERFSFQQNAAEEASRKELSGKIKSARVTGVCVAAAILLLFL